MYNEDIKKQFLSPYSNETQVTYRNVLLKAESEEERLEMDLYDFNLDDIKRVLFNMAPQTLNASVTYGAVISTYISWAISNGLRDNNINPMSGINRDYYEQFTQNVQLFHSESAIIELEDALVNYQDKVVVRLPFEGVTMKELLNLTEYDIDFELGKLSLRYLNERRDLHLWEETRDRSLEIIKGAIYQDRYISRNGTDPHSRRETVPLVDAKFIVRKSNSNAKSDPQAAYHVVANRFAVMKDVFGDYYTMSAQRLSQSGMIKMGKDLLLRDGRLERGHYLEIAERFNKKSNNEYNMIYQLRQLVNLESIQKVYPDIDPNNL